MQSRIDGLIQSLRQRLLSSEQHTWMNAPQQMYRELEQRLASEAGAQGRSRSAFRSESDPHVGEGVGEQLNAPVQPPAVDAWLGLALTQYVRSGAFEIYTQTPSLSPERLMAELLPLALLNSTAAGAHALDAAWDSVVERYSSNLTHYLPELEFSAPSNQSVAFAPTRGDTTTGSDSNFLHRKDSSDPNKRYTLPISATIVRQIGEGEAAQRNEYTVKYTRTLIRKK